MSNLQTDNDEKYISVKLQLRQTIIDTLDKVRCCECFGGDGILWSKLKKNNPEKDILILRIDQKQDKKGIYLKGDNVKFLKSIDLNQFNIIDLDAYGSPTKQLEIIFKKKYHGAIVVTFIQSMTGQLNKQFLYDLGYSESMIKKCPSLFNKDGFGKMKRWLSLKGVKKITFFSENRKNYFFFEI